MATRSRGAVNAAHTAGIFADMSLDGPEIGTLVAVVDRARNLPNRKTMGKQDPYCAMRLGKEAKKTETDRRGGQTPRWDQELRFTVHDSPDYYKLKCSVFNDDKKTDLIGEAWMDLHQVIVPGGGKNDLWHQLNFKGKYAGDIRVELTYYDSRPRPETPSASERKRQQLREKSQSSSSDTSYANSPATRQLGPRDIKRRPLPPGPTGHSLPIPNPPTPDQQNLPIQPDYTSDSWVPERSNNANPLAHPRKHATVPETPDDIGYNLQNHHIPQPYEQSPSPIYAQPDHYQEHQMEQHNHRRQKRPSQQNYSPDSEADMRPNSYQEDLQRSQSRDVPHYSTHEPYVTDDFESGHPPQEYPPSSRNSFGRPRDISDAITPPHSPQAALNSSPYYPSPPSRQSPQPPAQTTNQPQSWQRRGSASPTKHAPYKDSPLRQSISQHEMPHQHTTNFPQSIDDEPPPPPPAHGGQLVRMPVPYNSIQRPSPVAPQTPVKRASIDERSPLQRLEYDSYSAPRSAGHDSNRGPPPMQSYDSTQTHEYEPYRADAGLMDDPQAYTSTRVMSSHEMDYQKIEHVQRRSQSEQGPETRGEPQHSFDQGPYPPFGPPRRQQTFDSFEYSDDRQVRRSDPPIVRPRAISPNPGHSIPRKSITPTPSTPETRSLGSTPYGPDSYDVLNPGTSPAADMDPFASPDQSVNFARQRQLNEDRDQGPIIGNDGRVIDPSDHLPADTWAPEPERKNRKPEHVIKIRTREEARMHHRAGSSPVSARPQSMPTSPYQISPQGSFDSQPQNAPTPPAKIPLSPQASPPSGRNRLKKPMPTRPLPTQPYPHPQTSPAVMTTTVNTDRPKSLVYDSPLNASPSAGNIQRPSPADYQVPITRNRMPMDGPNRADYPSSPTKPSYPPAPYATDYPSYGDDSLALELSTIDIGPSRAGRTALRPHRGYAGY